MSIQILAQNPMDSPQPNMAHSTPSTVSKGSIKSLMTVPTHGAGNRWFHSSPETVKCEHHGRNFPWAVEQWHNRATGRRGLLLWLGTGWWAPVVGNEEKLFSKKTMYIFKKQRIAWKRMTTLKAWLGSELEISFCVNSAKVRKPTRPKRALKMAAATWEKANIGLNSLRSWGIWLKRKKH